MRFCEVGGREVGRLILRPQALALQSIVTLSEEHMAQGTRALCRGTELTGSPGGHNTAKINDWSNISVGRTFALHTNDPGLISSIP